MTKPVFREVEIEDTTNTTRTRNVLLSTELEKRKDMTKIEQMPDEFRGKIVASNQYNLSESREWTDLEIDWCLDMKKKGYNNKEIAESVGRTESSVFIKLKRLKKEEYTYNADHINDKYEANLVFFNMVKPKTILDIYCGLESWWEFNTDSVVSTNDINQNSKSLFHENAEKLIHKLYYNGCKYDLVDIDPFGSGFECFDLGIKMAQKAIVITFGEIGHKRWKRLDFVRRYYGIENLEDFTTENLIKGVLKIGERNKKKLNPVIVKEWRNISRVYFTIEPMKIVEQWNKQYDRTEQDI